MDPDADALCVHALTAKQATWVQSINIVQIFFSWIRPIK